MVIEDVDCFSAFAERQRERREGAKRESEMRDEGIQKSGEGCDTRIEGKEDPRGWVPQTQISQRK